MRKAGGFTLIELMIVIAILGALATLAVYSYDGYIKRGQRAKAMPLQENDVVVVPESFF